MFCSNQQMRAPASSASEAVREGAGTDVSATTFYKVPSVVAGLQCVAIAAEQYVARLTSCVRCGTTCFQSCAQNSRFRTLIAPLQQSRMSGPSTSLAALSSCLLCVRRMLVLVLIVQGLSCELVRMTSRISSCSFGLVMSSRGTRRAEDAYSSSVLGHSLATAGRYSCYNQHKHLSKAAGRGGAPALCTHE